MALRSHPSHHAALTHDADDLRKLSVYSRHDAEKVGKVDDVLADESGTPRYLSLELHHDDLDGRRVLVPIGHATIDHDDDRLWIDCSRAQLGATPDYSGDPSTVDEDYEHRVARSYDEGHDDHAYYDRPHYRGHGWGEGRSTGSHSDRRTETPKLVRVDDIGDIGVADDDPDPRGWKVVGRDGSEIGEVEYLLGDLDRMKVAYLVVEVDRGLFDEDRHVLVPAGHADLDVDDHRVRVRALDRSRVGELEPYREDAFDRSYEDRLLGSYDEGYTGESRYHHPRYRSTTGTTTSTTVG